MGRRSPTGTQCRKYRGLKPCSFPPKEPNSNCGNTIRLTQRTPSVHNVSSTGGQRRKAPTFSTRKFLPVPATLQSCQSSLLHSKLTESRSTDVGEKFCDHGGCYQARNQPGGGDGKLEGAEHPPFPLGARSLWPSRWSDRFFPAKLQPCSAKLAGSHPLLMTLPS